MEIKEDDLIFADLHLHSKYSRACSKDLDIPNLAKWAKIKGLNLLGTGDFTHPIWLKEIEKLREEKGIYYYIQNSQGNFENKDSKGKEEKFPFILSSEISLIYSKNNKGRRVHLLFFAPNLEAVYKINSWLDTKGRRDYDGRPIFGISCRDFVAKMEEIDKRIEVIPAHCLLPNILIHTENVLKPINVIQTKDKVLTHNGEYKEVKKLYQRDYNGEIIWVRPWYFSLGLKTTPEHPYYTIKTYKKCKSTKGLCKPLCSQNKVCARKPYYNYKPQWIQAKDLEIGDCLVYPRPNKEIDIENIGVEKFIKNYKILNKEYLIPDSSRNNRNKVKRTLKINNDFCRLIGYFLSEGYLIGKEAIGFSFHIKEKDYINDVINIIKNSFGIENYKIDSRRDNQGDIIFYSSVLNNFFKNFYISDEARSWNKYIPEIFLYLKNEKIAEILKGWWRGDFGYSVSRQLINQMKLLCLKLGIIPSIIENTSENHNKKKHYFGNREIISKNNLYCISNLSFFEEDYGMLKEKCFKKSINKIKRKHGWIDKNYIYIPIRKIEINNYNGKVYNLEVEEDNSYVSEFACVHNCWTPWFGIFGSEGGFDKLTDAFEDKTYLIHAIETGISSDPEMNWKIKELEDKAIISFSDAHSFWPWRLGREATIFKKSLKGELSYDEIIRQIKEKDFFGTIETDPAYGKYHFDGHRDCNFSCSPEETKKLNGICPVCKKPLIIGVEYRVNELSKLGISSHEKKKFYYKVLPLHEIISLGLGVGVNSKGTWKIYNDLINEFGNEYKVLLFAPKEEIFKVLKNNFLTDLIILNRDSKIQVKPGYDGVYGKALIGGKEVNLEGTNTSGKELNKDRKFESDQFKEVIRRSEEVQKKLF